MIMKYQWSRERPALLDVETCEGSTQLMDIIDKAEGILERCHNHSISLLGKVQVVNSLVASLFVYVLQCSGYPGNHFFEQYDKMVTKYLW